ncbi:hypothetical protein NPIL_306641 [Nephila pilipes]|uniref:Uncharacterized protein n=1 Tax=Nephila pilipes TaxID=299642 RepID=A0A8X6UAP9_NEPPI|nr:hypothetical protein NPIL_306641 [Nephila pilipes]
MGRISISGNTGFANLNQRFRSGYSRGPTKYDDRSIIRESRDRWLVVNCNCTICHPLNVIPMVKPSTNDFCTSAISHYAVCYYGNGCITKENFQRIFF